MTPKEAAIDLIRAYVERGDTLESLRAGQMGCYGDDYKASIGGSIFPIDTRKCTMKELLEIPKERIKKVGNDKILVERFSGKLVNEVFSLQEIFSIIKQNKPLQISLI